MTATTGMTPRVVNRDEWLKERKALLAEEKKLTKQRDALAKKRRALPWVRVEKDYVFDTVDGAKTLAALFGNNSQLIVQHFMFGPDWEQGCVGCSFGADHADAAYQHLRHHDVSYVAVARAPIDRLEAYRRRMGWRFPFASSLNSDFNYDFHVSFDRAALENGKVYYNYEMIEGKDAFEELPGASFFCRDETGAVYHTYSDYGRGGEEVLSTYMLLDMTPKGRNETGPMSWVKRHDEYDGGDGGDAGADRAAATRETSAA